MRFFALAFLTISALAERRVMPWMCLERCHEDIQPDLEQLISLKDVIKYVSPEAHDLYLEGTVIDCNFTRVTPDLQAAGITSYPMITSANITKLRQLWTRNNVFIEQALAYAIERKYDGINIDFEPDNGDPPTADDAREFCNFLTKFSDACHDKGLVVTVDIASWSDFWDFALLNQTSVDRFLTMDTYATKYETFTERLNKAVNAFGPKRMGMGLGRGLSAEEFQQRLDDATALGVEEIDIWDAPIPEDWIPIIKKWVSEG